MRDLDLRLPADDGSAFYLRLARGVRHGLQEGRLRPGDLLPSTRRLAQLYGVHRHTVMAAYDELVAEGWIEAEPGRGYRVTESLPEASRSRTSTRTWRIARSAAAPPEPLEKLPYRFPSGQPDLRAFPGDEYFRCMREILRSAAPSHLLGYDRAEGAEALRGQLATWLRRLRGLTGGEVVATHGSQEAIFLIAQLLVAPGDVVAVEPLGYPPAFEALRASGARLAALRMDADGLLPDSLERLARRRAVRLLYVTPLHQYPTTATLPVARRRLLYRVCERYGIPILEDDYDHEFHYRSQPLPPLAADDPAGLVLYVSTFSKLHYPAARLGFAVVPPALAGRLAALKHVTTRQNDTLLQLTLARWMEIGGLDRHLRRCRRLYERRMTAMAEALDGAPVEFRRPDGGMSLWVDFGVDSVALEEAARRRGVGIVAGARYRLTPGPSQHVRLGFASSTEEEIREGMRRLLRAAAEVRRG